MIRQETWYKESTNLDRQLQELKRRVKSNDLDAVTELTVLLQRVSPGAPTLYEDFRTLFEEAHPGGSRKQTSSFLIMIETYHRFINRIEHNSLRMKLSKLIDYVKATIQEMDNLHTLSWHLYTGELESTIVIPSTWERAEEYSKKAGDLWGDILNEYGEFLDRFDKGLEYGPDSRPVWERE